MHVEESEGPITPYWDPRLRGDPLQRTELLHKLADFKILSFRARAHVFAGLFFVKKKDEMIRLIVDSRRADRDHTRPQAVRQRYLASICLTNVFCRHLGSGISPKFNSAALGAMFEMDSINFRFTAQPITSRCSLRFELGTSASLKFTTQRLTVFFSVEPNDQVWPVVEAMPMGVVLGSSRLHGRAGARCCVSLALVGT